MLHYLAINGLLGYILREKLKPSSSNEPQAYDNWVENDHFRHYLESEQTLPAATEKSSTLSDIALTT
jgi:hypothetical protein